ncbi:MAG: RNA polymerase factor sigma-54 [Methylococcales symbiont of Iophon sp. n. MRB-2018]|nr:MAG: RNA polymerase factor sigma-54 [Methylococcales symbiont of Iophon sp. n. MRB-2018]KAF3980176.1 MAG: RNA polymerase factor sigma-54 [Methylococcales symbiont of Iophon sp. n. MRB-2018]
MKQSLQLRIGQNLTMTPQLQQAIKLLQLSTLDLQQEIQQALDSNIMLEVDEEDLAVTQEDLVNTQEHAETSAEITLTSQDEATSEGSQTNVPDELPVDSDWDDVFENTRSSTSMATETAEFETQHSNSVTIVEYLLQQLELISISERDHAIAIGLIDSVNTDGYIAYSLEDIFLGLQPQIKDIELDEIKAVLHRIQNFEPIGIAALDLADCLLIQLKSLPENVAFRKEAIDLASHHLDLLASHNLSRLMRRLGLAEFQLKEVIALIRTLDPKPGIKIQSVDSEYIVPDVFVLKQNGQWCVNLNPDIAPKLRVNSTYSEMIKRSSKSKDNVRMKEHLQEARWFIKNLYSRNETLLRVAKSIVAKQEGFLDHGAIAMQPLILKNIAEELELHESTISRVTTQKYMHTPNGIVEFKHFFSSHVSTEGGGKCSATAIQALIKELVKNENQKKPLSDSKISDLLKEKGIKVARRTIAKYRKAMSIQSSSQRKRLL